MKLSLLILCTVDQNATTMSLREDAQISLCNLTPAASPGGISKETALPAGCDSTRSHQGALQKAHTCMSSASCAPLSFQSCNLYIRSLFSNNSLLNRKPVSSILIC